MQKREIERLLKKVDTINKCRKSLMGLRYGSSLPDELDKRLREASRLTNVTLKATTPINQNFEAADALLQLREDIAASLADALDCDDDVAIFKAQVKVNWPAPETASIY